MNRTNEIKQHYDLLSPYYYDLWGEHLHHGYYLNGNESKKVATENLIRLLVNKSDLKRRSKVLDVGCGFGGTSRWLAQEYQCRVTGINLSPVQVGIAHELSRNTRPRPRFIAADANELSITEQYDVVWAVETISHLNERDVFFKSISELLHLDGKICVAAWLKNENLSDSDSRTIERIEKGMLVDLPTLSEYQKHTEHNGLTLAYYEDISEHVARTWDITSNMIRRRSIWKLAKKQGREFVDYLKSFNSMRMGYRTGALKYSIFVMKK